MNHLNKNQLAFVLQIKAEDARAKMCHAWCQAKGIENKAFLNEKEKIEDEYPDAMPIDLLAEGLNLPTLQQSIDDIASNYLKRPASKKWILCDYPEKEIEKGKKAGKALIKLNIPKALRSMIKPDVQKEIKKEWQQRHALKDREGRDLIIIS
jgi:hypothetical protein